MSETKTRRKETTVLRRLDPSTRGYLRQWTRNAVALPAKVELRLEDGRRFTSGTAIIRDISLKGARLGKLLLKKQVLPAANFKVYLSFKSQEMKGIGAVARPIRFGQGDEFELAVEFEDLWADEEK